MLFHQGKNFELHQGDCEGVLAGLPERSVNCCVTSPPYWKLRKYEGGGEEIGWEPTPEAYIASLVQAFRALRRVLRDDGVAWLNLGDCFASKADGNRKRKDLVGIPWAAAFALRDDGWHLRSEVVWAKGVSGQRELTAQVRRHAADLGVAPEVVEQLAERLEPFIGSGMPESCRDRPSRSHEHIFMLAKSPRYAYDDDAVREPYSPMTIATTQRKRMIAEGKFSAETEFRGNHTGKVGGTGERMLKLNPKGRNRRSVWTIPARPFKGAHFATFSPELVEPCVLAGCPGGGTVVDIFNGSGTVGEVALKQGRRYIGIDLNREYLAMSRDRLAPLDA